MPLTQPARPELGRLFHIAVAARPRQNEKEPNRHAIRNDRDRDIVPKAEATLDAFWRSHARAQFVSRFDGPGCGLEAFE